MDQVDDEQSMGRARESGAIESTDGAARRLESLRNRPTIRAILRKKACVGVRELRMRGAAGYRSTPFLPERTPGGVRTYG